jgi:hypothetical protein
MPPLCVRVCSRACGSRARTDTRARARTHERRNLHACNACKLTRTCTRTHMQARAHAHSKTDTSPPRTDTHTHAHSAQLACSDVLDHHGEELLRAVGFRDDDAAASTEPAFVLDGAVPVTALETMVKALKVINDHAYGTGGPIGQVRP